MSNWNTTLYNKPPIDMDGVERNLHDAYESCKCVGGPDYVMKHLHVAAELLRAERDTLAAQLKEARELAEAWEDYVYDYGEPCIGPLPPTCPWRGK